MILGVARGSRRLAPVSAEIFRANTAAAGQDGASDPGSSGQRGLAQVLPGPGARKESLG